MNGLLKVKQVADMLGLHTNTVYRYIHRGQLKAFRLGTANYRISKEDLESFIKGAGSAHGRHAEELCNSSEQVADPALSGK